MGLEQGLRVVVVDDTEDIRTLMAMVMARAGCVVVAQAADGRAGVDAVVEHQPDVVLLDVMMPVMSGIDALPLMRAASPRTRVVMMSAVTDPEVVARAASYGAGWVSKGAPLREMVAQIEALLGPGTDGGDQLQLEPRGSL